MKILWTNSLLCDKQAVMSFRATLAKISTNLSRKSNFIARRRTLLQAQACVGKATNKSVLIEQNSE
jgi:hypothetical protein